MFALNLFILVSVPLAICQRPSTLSVCDYYAAQKYGSNSTANQLQLVQHIVSLAFAGRGNLTNISAESTGIMNPGVFENNTLDLKIFFNGSIASTNFNGAAAGINWLDGGGLTPLHNYLEGRTPDLVIANTTNQFHLFNHFFVAFGHLFACSSPPVSADPVTAPRLNLAYVHKFMNLTHEDLGYFISQMAQAAITYGFSDQDANTLATNWNNMYNVRCAPATGTPPQLLSLCQNPTCPLPISGADCESYVNLTATGAGAVLSQSTVTATVTGATTLTPLSSSTMRLSSSSSTSPTATSEPSNSPSSSPIGAGAIAGISIGGAAVLVLATIALALLRRRRRPQTPPPQEQQQQREYTRQPGSDIYSPTFGSGVSSSDPKDMRSSYVSNPSGYFGHNHSSQGFQGYMPNQYAGSQDVIHEVYAPTPVEMGASPVPQMRQMSPSIPGSPSPYVETFVHDRDVGQERYGPM